MDTQGETYWPLVKSVFHIYPPVPFPLFPPSCMTMHHFFALMNNCCLFGVYHFARFDISPPFLPAFLSRQAEGQYREQLHSPVFFFGVMINGWQNGLHNSPPTTRFLSLKFCQAKSFCLEPVVSSFWIFFAASVKKLCCARRCISCVGVQVICISSSYNLLTTS